MFCSAATAPARAKGAKTTKKSRAAKDGRPDDLTPEPSPKGGDPDYVMITDDDE